MVSLSVMASAQQDSGSIRGLVRDKDFDVPLAGASITIVETGQVALSTGEGNFVFPQIPAGRYTLIFIKEGYYRQVRADVLVTAGQLADVDVELNGEFTELDEYIVRDLLQPDAGSEAALLRMRFESPALMDSIGSELMSRAGAGDAATALKLVAGASVQGGKYAVIRGLPDRYVNSQMNGVRLPSADEDKRAVELDQFPTAVISSIQVSKTFTPDQQGDASGGAVNVILKGLPDEPIFQLKTQYTYSPGLTGRDDFLTYRGGGLSFFGLDDGGRDKQLQNLGSNWDGAAGVSEGTAPTDHKWSFTAGNARTFDNGVRVGGIASLFYERSSSFHDDGRDDSLWVETPGAGMVPQTNQGTPGDGNFKTSLFDVVQGSQSVTWGGLASLGIETERNFLGLSYLYTRNARDTATLAQDTRGKEYFFPGYDPNNPTGNGNQPNQLDAAPHLRLETLEYTERSTSTLQLGGRHSLDVEDYVVGSSFRFKAPELSWTASHSTADMYQPDKRVFGALFHATSFDPGVPPFTPPSTTPATWFPYFPAANFNLGNFQRIWKSVNEESDQYSINLNFPFEQWTADSGYVKVGLFDDSVKRGFDQDTFSNFGDAGAFFVGEFDEFWSASFPAESHPITESLFDVDYRATQDIKALYAMVDMPLSKRWSVIGGARAESTRLDIANDPESSATWIPPGATAPVSMQQGDGDVSFRQDDLLPSIGVVYEPAERWTLRSSFSQTVARQTFKELTPILQQEYAGGPIFIGEPTLEMSALDNYDLRADYVPYEGGLVSCSWFKKDIRDPIEYVQRLAGFTYTTPINYPKGELTGFELELRQDIGVLSDSFAGLTVGANGTLIESEVILPAAEAAAFNLPGIQAPMRSRDMTNAPEYLCNFFVTYDIAKTDTQIALFYTIQGDTLVAGAGQALGNFVPNAYALGYDTLNLSVSQRLGKYFKLQFQAKNLTDPSIEEVYRSPYIGGDVEKSSYSRGIEYSLSLTATIAL